MDDVLVNFQTGIERLYEATGTRMGPANDLSKIKIIRRSERGGISEESIQELLRRSLERIEFMKYHLREYDNFFNRYLKFFPKVAVDLSWSLHKCFS